MMKKNENAISREVFDHLVDLASFELGEKEKKYLHDELNKQLNSIRELEAIPLPDDLPVTTHGVDYGKDGKPALREDTWDACENAKEIIAQAPELDNDYIVVPDIPTAELE